MPEFAALKPGRNGEVFRFGNPASLAEAMNKMLNPMHQQKLSDGALETIRDDWSMPAMVDRFVSAFGSVARRSS